MNANRCRWIAVGLALAAAPGAGSAETVLCQSSHATTCAPGGGCEKDRARAALFTVDRAAGRVTDAEGNAWAIVPIEGGLPAAEPAIVASGIVAGPASETLLIGERSFVASHVSLAPARVSVQVGTCEGLARPE